MYNALMKQMKIFVSGSESATYALEKGSQLRVKNKHENLCYMVFALSASALNFFR